MMVSSQFLSKICKLSELSFQEVGDFQNCTVCIADLEVPVDRPCDLSVSQMTLTAVALFVLS